MEIKPVTLEGNHIRLEPVRLDHVAALWSVSAYEEIWRYLPYNLHSEDDMRIFIEAELDKQQSGIGFRFATIDKTSGQPVGSTSYLTIDRQHRHLEIGGTWITPSWQRSAVNTEAKYLQLSHAFDTLGCIRVEFKTDSLNVKSKQALARIGAVEEGTFRNHRIMPDGRLRHSVYFSIIDSEWPSVKAHLEQVMSSYGDEGQ